MTGGRSSQIKTIYVVDETATVRVIKSWLEEGGEICYSSVGWLVHMRLNCGVQLPQW